MSIYAFDYYGQPEVPVFVLANPDGTELYSLGSIYDRKLELRYNALSKLTFTAPTTIDGVDTDYYDFLAYRRIIKVGDIANFMITDIDEDTDGINQYKTVTCESLEVQLLGIKISLFKGTFNFYDPASPSTSLLGNLMTYIPGWSLNIIDSDLVGIYRTFEVTDKSLYDFLMNEISQTYQCIFTFDSINKTISAYSIQNATTDTDIFLSFDNLMLKKKIKIITTEIITALTVLGSQNLSINQVNPLGTNIIYNFDYYKNLDWMTQDLIDAITNWETKTDYFQPIYSDLLLSIETANAILIGYQSEMADLEATLASLYDVLRARLEAHILETDVEYLISAQNVKIISKQTDISNITNQINDLEIQLTAINTDLSFDTNFTQAQQIVLNSYIIGNTYTNSNFIATDTMTLVEIQQMAQGLYDLAKGILLKVSQPRYTFDVEAVNFPFLKEFQTFSDQLSLGCIITIDMEKGSFIRPILLGLDFSYDDPSQFQMIFSNRARLDNNTFQYSDLFNTTLNSGLTTNFNSQQWNSWLGYKNTILSTLNNTIQL